MGRIRTKEAAKREAFLRQVERYLPQELLGRAGLLTEPPHCTVGGKKGGGARQWGVGWGGGWQRGQRAACRCGASLDHVCGMFCVVLRSRRGSELENTGGLV
jgi:hypothetical protein